MASARNKFDVKNFQFGTSILQTQAAKNPC